MKYFAAIMMVAFWFDGWSQITITSSHMASSGDTVRYSQAPITDLPDLNLAGTNVSWDMTDLGLLQQDIHEFKASYLTPYIINFGFTATGLKIADSLGQSPMLLTQVYDFYKKSSTKYENIGIGFIPDLLKYPQSGKHSDPDEIYLFPLDYGDTFSSTFALEVTINAVGFPVGSFFRSGKRFTHVDGWGKISTPYGSDIDCIRVKAVIDSYDSLAISTLSVYFGTNSRQVVYKWLSTSEKIPVVEIAGTEVAGNFIPQYIRYRDNYRKAPGPIQVDFMASQTTVYTGDTVNLTNNTTGQILSYKWNIDPSSGWQFANGSTSTSKDISISFSDTGKYSVKLVAKGIFSSDSLTKTDYITVNDAAGIQSLADHRIAVYPVPAKGAIHITNNTDEELTYVLINLIGTSMINGTIEKNKTGSFQTKQIPNGVYSLVFNINGSVSTRKMIIQH